MDQSSNSPTTSPSWTFFTNHAHVLFVLALQENMVLREIANKVQITERAVQKIISELEDAGFIERERIGRKNTYKLHLDKPLRHPIEAHRTIADVIQMLKNNQEPGHFT